MKVLPPGNILQNLYIKKRLGNSAFKSFLEIGSGNGYISNELLSMGLTGIGCDLNSGACENNTQLNIESIRNGKYKVIHGDFITSEWDKKFDLILSSMVIEHLPDHVLKSFIEKAKEVLSPDGMIVFLVPSSMAHWGIEDEIAGHIKRYEFHDFETFKEKYDLAINHIAGLTYPLSNWLFSISNRLIKKQESSKLNLSQKEKTIYTGNREVAYKTTFPAIFKIILNDIVLYPFHVLQMLFRKSPKSLVIYCELKPIK